MELWEEERRNSGPKMMISVLLQFSFKKLLLIQVFMSVGSNHEGGESGGSEGFGRNLQLYVVDEAMEM